MVEDMAQEAHTGERVGLVNFVADPGQIGPAIDEFPGNIVGVRASARILKRSRVSGDGGKKAIGDGRGDGPVGRPQQAEN